MLKMVSFHIQAHLNAFIDNSLGPLAREARSITYVCFSISTVMVKTRSDSSSID
jgi:hypothetical protein